MKAIIRSGILALAIVSPTIPTNAGPLAGDLTANALGECLLENAEYTTAKKMDGPAKPSLMFSKAHVQFGVIATMTTSRGKTVTIDFTVNNGFAHRWAVMDLGGGVVISPHLMTFKSDLSEAEFGAGISAPHVIVFPLSELEAYNAFRSAGVPFDVETGEFPHPGPWVISGCRKAS